MEGIAGRGNGQPYWKGGLLSLQIYRWIVTWRFLTRLRCFTIKNWPMGALISERSDARGCFQTEGWSYDETYAPAPALKSFRLFFILTTILNLDVYQFDITAAFLNSPIQYEVWVKAPKGYKGFGKFTHGRLLKSMYGLKQAARDWWMLQEKFVLKYDSRIRKSSVEPCLYYFYDDSEGEPLWVMILVQVDDYLMATNSSAYKAAFIEAYNKVFDLVDLGMLEYVIQTKVDKVDGSFELSQTRQIDQLMVKYNLEGARTFDTPMEPGLQLEKGTGEIDQSIPYLNLIGSLFWIARVYRPDIMFPTMYSSQFSNSYTHEHFTHAKRIVRYLMHTRDYVFRITPEIPEVYGQITISGYGDSDWASDIHDRKSVCGGVVLLNGAVVDWSSKKQATVACSTPEAEYMGGSELAKDLLWWLHLLNEMAKHTCLTVIAPVEIMLDNQGAIFMSKHTVNTRKSRHIAIRYHFVRDYVSKKVFTFGYVPTGDNFSDALTKALGRIKFQMFRTLLGVQKHKVG